MLGLSPLGSRAFGSYPTGVALTNVPITLTMIWAALQDIQAKVDAMAKRDGVVIGVPVVITQNGITAGDVTQTISTAGNGTVTVTRT